jgi:hypothetical protein
VTTTCDMWLCSNLTDGFYLCEECIDRILADLLALELIEQPNYKKTVEIDLMDYVKFDRENFENFDQ